jgi:hypothetical protein
MYQKLIYLASPYSSADPNTITRRVLDVQKATASLIEQGHLIFSPIVHSHPIHDIVSFSSVNGPTMSDWMKYDFAMIDKADELWVLMLDGWIESKGVAAEIEHAIKTNKPIAYISFPSLTRTAVQYSKSQADGFADDDERLVEALNALGFEEIADKAAHALNQTVAPWWNPTTQRTTALPDDAEARNAYPMAEGLLYYFPNALAEVSKISRFGNEQHNPGEPMHWARGKSTDHANKIIRHLVDAGKKDSNGNRHSAFVAWRALALLQEELERANNLPLPKNAYV